MSELAIEIDVLLSNDDYGFCFQFSFLLRSTSFSLHSVSSAPILQVFFFPVYNDTDVTSVVVLGVVCLQCHALVTEVLTILFVVDFFNGHIYIHLTAEEGL